MTTDNSKEQPMDLTEGDILHAAINHVKEKHPDCLGDKPLQVLMKAKIVMAYMDAANWMQQKLKSTP